MRNILILLLISIFLVGCQTKSKVVKEEPKEGEEMDKYSEDLYIPIDVIKTIPGKLNDLKPGMSFDEVLAILGLSSYSIDYQRSGPIEDQRYLYFLQPGYNLLLFFDCTDKPKFKKAELAGDNWKNK